MRHRSAPQLSVALLVLASCAGNGAAAPVQPPPMVVTPATSVAAASPPSVKSAAPAPAPAPAAPPDDTSLVTSPVTTPNPNAPPLPTTKLVEPPVSPQARPPLAWILPVPGAGLEAMKFLDDGSLLLAGGCSGVSKIADRALTCSEKSPEHPEQQLYLARIDRRGSAAWVTKISGYVPRRVDLAVDAATGESVLVFVEQTSAMKNSVVMRIAFDGTQRWATKLPGQYPDFHRVGMNGRGDVAATQWCDRCGRKPGELGVVWRLAPDGRVLWSKPFAPPQPAPNLDTVARHVRLDEDGNVAAFQFSMRHDPDGVGRVASNAESVAQWSSTGAVSWKVVVDSWVENLDRDPAGGWLVSGGIPRPCIHRLGADGRGTSKVCAKNGDELSLMQVSGSAGAVVAHRLDGPRDVGGKKLAPAPGNGQDILLARLDARLSPVWSFGLGGPGDDQAQLLATSRGGRIALSGSVDRAITVDGRTVKKTDSPDGHFVAMFGP